MRYTVNAIMNGNVVATNKKLKTMKDVQRYINSILDKYNEQVEDECVSNNGRELICSDHSRIFIKEVVA